MNQAATRSNSSGESGKASPGKIAVLFDGACSMCRAAAEEMRKFDDSDSLELFDLHHPDVSARFPELRLEHLLRELHIVDDAGRIYRGARAINEILRHQSGMKHYLAYLWYVPGFPWLADWQYRRLAASRYDCVSKASV